MARRSRASAFRPGQPPAAAGGGGAPSGSAGGSLAGTYPNPTLAAGSVTATEIATGAVDVSSTDVTGTLAAGRFPALTGDVTTSAGALATAIANGAVTLAKHANMAAQSLLGNSTTSAAAPAELSVATASDLLRAGGAYTPKLNGTLLAASSDPFTGGINTSVLLIASTTYTTKVWLPPGTYTNYMVYCQTVGNTLAANLYCFYICNADATGTVVANTVSADATAVWLTTGAQTIGLGTPLVTTVGAYYFIVTRTGTASTQPKVVQSPSVVANAGCVVGSNVAPNAANVPRYGLATNAPTGLTPTNTGNIINSGSVIPFWVGLT